MRSRGRITEPRATNPVVDSARIPGSDARRMDDLKALRLRAAGRTVLRRAAPLSVRASERI
jgi:hypothetical protein